jgi:UDP-GlcNAc:undecaprenyl-phosphate GlcNAc-1-phosphate transferase
MPMLATLLLSVFLTMALIPLCSRLALAVHAVDLPDARKVHSRPIPRGGGPAMAMGIFLPVILWVPHDPFFRAFLFSSAIIIVFGVLDDIRDLSCGVKFAAQTAAALVIVFWGGLEIQRLGDLLPEGATLPLWLGAALATVIIVGVTNAVNFSDGLDGLAGGISLLGFICIGFMAHGAGDESTTLLCLAVIGAIFGFLRFNTHPANLFMGDSGSQLLGFAAVTLSVKTSQAETGLSPLVPLILLGFPVLDLLVVMFERIASGRSPFRPDRNHFHHKLMRCGLDQDEAVFIIYVIQAFLVSVAFLMRFQSEWLILFFYAVFSGLVLAGFHAAERKGWRWRGYDLVGVFIKGRLRAFCDGALIARWSFRGALVGLNGLLLVTWVIPDWVPSNLSLFAWGCGVAVGGVWIFRKEWLGNALRVSLYLSIPFGVYLSETEPSGWIPEILLDACDIAFGILVVLVVLTLKFTRRNRGFRTTPMDFLTIFITLVIPRLPDAQLQQYNLGLLSAKIIVFFFSYEVLMGELRGEYKSLACATLGVLVLVGIRGFM